MNDRKLKTFLRELAADFRWSHLFVLACLMTLSLLFIYSARYRGGGMPPMVRQQAIWFLVGTAAYIVVSMIDYHWICRQAWIAYGGVLLLLVAVLTPLGIERYHAKRWLPLGSIQIQPSEFAKISVLLLLCHLLGRWAGAMNDWRRLFIAMGLALVPAVLIHKEPDLGTAMVIVAMLLMLLFLSGASMRFLASLGAIGCVVALLLFHETERYRDFLREKSEGSIAAKATFHSNLHLKPYQLKRILGVIAPEELDPLGDGYNRLHSLIAIGNGGHTGRGWLKGEETHGGFLPTTVSHNDFIFAVFAEETGFWGSVVLIFLYSILLMSGVRIAMNAREPLGMLLAAGVTFLFFFHVFVNMGMTLGVLPIVGVPLPLMSYGGSFVLVCMTALGLLQSVWLHRKPY